MSDSVNPCLLISELLVNVDTTANEPIYFTFNDIPDNQSITDAVVGISGFKVKYRNTNKQGETSLCIKCGKPTINNNTVCINPSFTSNVNFLFVYITCIVTYSTKRATILLCNLQNVTNTSIDVFMDKGITFISGFSLPRGYTLGSENITSLKIQAAKPIVSGSIPIQGYFKINSEDYCGETDIGIAGFNDSKDYLQFYSGNNSVSDVINHEFENEISDFAFLINKISFNGNLPEDIEGFYCNFELGEKVKLSSDNKTVSGSIKSHFYNTSNLLNNNYGLDIQYVILGLSKENNGVTNKLEYTDTSLEEGSSFSKKSTEISDLDYKNVFYTDFDYNSLLSMVVIEEINMMFIAATNCRDTQGYITENITTASINNSIPPSITINKSNVYNWGSGNVPQSIDSFIYKDFQGVDHYYIIGVYENNTLLYYNIWEIDGDTGKFNLVISNKKYGEGVSPSISICNNQILEMHMKSPYNVLYIGLSTITVDNKNTPSFAKINYQEYENICYPACSLFYDGKSQNYAVALASCDSDDMDETSKVSLRLGIVDNKTSTITWGENNLGTYKGFTPKLFCYNSKYLFLSTTQQASSKERDGHIFTYRCLDITKTNEYAQAFLEEKQTVSPSSQGASLAIYKNSLLTVFFCSNDNKLNTPQGVYFMSSFLYENDLNTYSPWHYNKKIKNS